MQFKKNFLFIITIFTNVLVINAQWKVNANYCTSNKIGNTVDSTLFASNSGTQASVNGAYYWGRLGLGVKVSKLKHNPKDSFANSTPPNFRPQSTRSGEKGGSLNGTSILTGIELSICYKKFRFIPSIKAGVIIQKKEQEGVIILVNSPAVGGGIYRSDLKNNITPITELGSTFAYKINKKIGLTLNAAFTKFTTQTSLQDFRQPGITKTVAVKNNLLQLGVGTYYTF
jgi:hypothetical protein